MKHTIYLSFDKNWSMQNGLYDFKPFSFVFGFLERKLLIKGKIDHVS